MNNRQSESAQSRPKDYGGHPYVANIQSATIQNNYFRRTFWTGCHLQMTLMSIPPGGEIGTEIHQDTDQFLKIEYGRAVVEFGDCREKVAYSESVGQGGGIFVPAGTWHNIINDSRAPLKLYSIYAPPHHPKGTVQRTKDCE